MLDQAVQPVERHVDQEAQPEQVQRAPGGTQVLLIELSSDDERKQEKEGIHRNGGCRVQRMIADRTPLGIVDGVGEQVIEVDEHRRDHDQGSLAPAATVEHERDEHGDGEV